MKSLLFSLVVITTVVVGFSNQYATTWYIKPDGTGDAPTIQAGISSAAAGDIVLLASGTYTGPGNRSMSFVGKAITVTSEMGRDLTIIDCQGLGYGFIFNYYEGYSSVLSGVTIHNSSGSALYFAQCNPIISNNIIRGSSTSGDGGGIYCDWNTWPKITGNIISGNTAGGNGGGIYCYMASPVISNNIISGNIAGGNGGGIYIEYFTSSISSNTISENSAITGGGIYCGQIANPSIENTIISFSIQGEGIYCSGGNPTLINCDIYGNAGGDALCGIDGGGNVSSDPLYCGILGSGNYYLRSISPCAPDNHPSGMLVGAWPVGCGGTVTREATWGEIKAMYK